MKSNKSTGAMLWLTAYATLASVAVGTLLNLPEGQSFWTIFAVFALIAVEMAFFQFAQNRNLTWLYLLVITLTTASLYFFNIPPGLYLVIFFVISAQAMMSLEGLNGLGWIFLLAVISTLSFVRLEGMQEALMLMLVYGGGYLFFGIFGKALQDATYANERSQQLYDELQKTHAQLQQSVQQLEELAVTSERNRLAREMHDSIGHRLTVSAVQLEGAQRLIPQDPDKAAGIVGTVREQVREALAELRQTVTALRQPIEFDLPIGQALERLAASFETGTDLKVELTLADLPALYPQHRQVIYRTVQESLTNIQRHAGATRAWVHLHAAQEILSLTISDNGKGLPDSAPQQGYGLRGIQERAALLGGGSSFEARTGGGAQISVWLPIIRETANE
jgi:signal transduction histidine kinase